MSRDLVVTAFQGIRNPTVSSSTNVSFSALVILLVRQNEHDDTFTFIISFSFFTVELLLLSSTRPLLVLTNGKDHKTIKGIPR